MEATIEREIAAPAGEVWTVLGENFGDMEWSSGISQSHLVGDLGVGAERVCAFPPNMFSSSGEVREKLLTFDRDERAFSYEAALPSGVMRRAVNRWTVTALGPDRCTVKMRASVEFRGVMRWLAPLLGPLLRKMGSDTLKELEVHMRARADKAAAQPA